MVIIGCTKKLLWKNQGRPCWIQRENNDVNVYATSKSSLSVKKKKGYFRSTDMFLIFLAYKSIISAGVCNFLSSLAMFTTTYKLTLNPSGFDSRWSETVTCPQTLRKHVSCAAQVPILWYCYLLNMMQTK